MLQCLELDGELTVDTRKMNEFPWPPFRALYMKAPWALVKETFYRYMQRT